MSDPKKSNLSMKNRFRGYLPVVVDVETAGFNADRDALLEIAAVLLHFDDEGKLVISECYHEHIEPFAGANLDPKSLEFTGIKPFNPFRFAKNERTALENIFSPIREALKEHACQRAVLVGHNPAFDLSFINAAIERNRLNNNPFHKFTTFDTATLAALIYGQTVLLKAAQAASIDFDSNSAHSAEYDARKTAELFCKIVNTWHETQQ
jgi:ribonuclease T